VEDFDTALAATSPRTRRLSSFAHHGDHNNAARIAAWASQNQLSAVSWERGFPAAGGLMSYGPNLDGLARRAAVFVDKTLKGAKPADLRSNSRPGSSS